MGATVSQNDDPPPPLKTAEERKTSNPSPLKTAEEGKTSSGSNSNSSDVKPVNTMSNSNDNSRVSDAPNHAHKKKINSSNHIDTTNGKVPSSSASGGSSKEKEAAAVQQTAAATAPSDITSTAIASNKTLITAAAPPTLDNKTSQRTPHNYQVIIKDADQDYNTTISSTDQQVDLQQLQHGVFLSKKRKKYWVDNSWNNCFMVFARDLSITWGENKQYWHWPYLPESTTSNEVLIDVAELLNVCWLEVHGTVNVSKYLTPGVNYEAVFVVMLRDPAYGWDAPVHLKLVVTGPAGEMKYIHQHKENLLSKPRGQWIELYVGEFQVPSSTPNPNHKAGEEKIQVSMFEYEDGKWKRGLVIKGLIVRPTKK